jgi:hypothetical protein
MYGHYGTTTISIYGNTPLTITACMHLKKAFDHNEEIIINGTIRAYTRAVCNGVVKS